MLRKFRLFLKLAWPFMLEDLRELDSTKHDPTEHDPTEHDPTEHDPTELGCN